MKPSIKSAPISLGNKIENGRHASSITSSSTFNRLLGPARRNCAETEIHQAGSAVGLLFSVGEEDGEG
jgi:hypothetical protein